MKFHVHYFELDKSDYFYIFLETLKSYLPLYILSIPFIICFFEHSPTFFIALLVFMPVMIIVKILSIAEDLKKLITDYYVEVQDEGIFIFNSSESNYYIKFSDIKYVFVSKDGLKASIITNSDTYSTISTLLGSYDELLDILRSKKIIFREDVLNSYNSVLAEYKEM